MKVRTAGFEPALSCSRSTRNTRLSYVLLQSAQRELNPHFRHGKATGCRYIMGANKCAGLSKIEEHRAGLEPASPHYGCGILAAGRPVLVGKWGWWDSNPRHRSPAGAIDCLGTHFGRPFGAWRGRLGSRFQGLTPLATDCRRSAAKGRIDMLSVRFWRGNWATRFVRLSRGSVSGEAP